MSSILIDHHNKLGDNLICNGLVREYCKQYDRVGIFCIPRYLESVSFMYRDLNNLRFEMVENHAQKRYVNLLNRFRFGERHYDTILNIQNDAEAGIVAELQFYGLAGVSHEKKWSSFYVERDKERELSLFNKVASQGPYAFVHDDNIYTSPVNLAKAGSSLPPVHAEKNLTDNIFDYCLLIERAAEVHVVDSAFMFLVDLLQYHNPEQKLFVHRYARENPPWQLPVLKKNWTILT